MPDLLTIKAISLGADLVYPCDVASGNLQDAVGSNNATATGSATYQVDDQLGQPSAVRVDGSSDYFTFVNPLIGYTAYTIEALLKINTIGGGGQHIVDCRDSGGDGVRVEIFTDGSGTIWRTTHNSVLTEVTETPLTDVWYHLHVTWSGTRLKTYIDAAELDDVAASSALDLSGNAAISARSFSAPTNKIAADFSHVGIYPAALSQSQIASLVQAGRGASSSTLQRVGYGKLSGVIGTQMRGRIG